MDVIVDRGRIVGVDDDAAEIGLQMKVARIAGSHRTREIAGRPHRCGLCIRGMRLRGILTSSGRVRGKEKNNNYQER